MSEYAPDDPEGELLGREFVTSIVIFHDTVGRSLGLSAVERKTIDVLKRLGPAPVSVIVQHTGLTSGSVTGLVDRLVQRGYAQRTADTDDRRRVLVSLTDNTGLDQHLAAIFEPLRTDMRETMANYTADELAVIGDFQRRTADLLREHTSRIANLHPPDSG